MKEKEAIMEQLSFNDRERFVVYSIDQCFKWQDDRKKNILESIEAFDPILDRLAVVLGLSPVAVKYATPEESFTDHANLFIRVSRYKNALLVKSDPYRFIEEIAKAGYATDPSYASKLKSLAATIEKLIP